MTRHVLVGDDMVLAGIAGFLLLLLVRHRSQRLAVANIAGECPLGSLTGRNHCSIVLPCNTGDANKNQKCCTERRSTGNAAIHYHGSNPHLPDAVTLSPRIGGVKQIASLEVLRAHG